MAENFEDDLRLGPRSDDNVAQVKKMVLDRGI